MQLAEFDSFFRRLPVLARDDIGGVPDRPMMLRSCWFVLAMVFLRLTQELRHRCNVQMAQPPSRQPRSNFLKQPGVAIGVVERSKGKVAVVIGRRTGDAAVAVGSKLSTGFLLMALSGWMVWDRDARRCLATPGPWLALLIFAALVAPLAQWLLAHDFAPLHYGATRARTAQGGVLQFLVTLLLTAAGLFLVLGIAGLIGLRAPAQMALSPQQPPVTARVKRYLVAVTGGPLALALIGAVASGSSLKVAWGSSMLNLAGLLAVALTRNRFTEKALCRIAACALALLIVLPLGYAGVVVAWPLRTTGRHLRANWPQAEISRRFVDLWTRQTGQPLRIVSGDPWIAGLIGITATDNPSIWNGPEPSASPWITPERLKREGMLVVWDAERQRVAPHVLERIGSTPVGQERFRWNSAGTREDLVIAYVIVLPQPDRR